MFFAYGFRHESRVPEQVVFDKSEGVQRALRGRIDAHGWAHFKSGGNTVVALPGANGVGSFVVNPIREFVVAGGSADPRGTIIFRLGPSGE